MATRIPQSDQSEGTPVMGKNHGDIEDPRSPRKGAMRPRDKMRDGIAEQKRRIAEKAQRDKEWQRRMKCGIYICTLIAISCIYGIILLIYNYYEGVYEYRDVIDNKTSIVSDKLIDYEDPQQRQVNCTNINTCNDWDCKYVKEHFHQDPDECEYKDNLELVTFILILCGICILCSLIREYC
tara:strand:+ start:18 stop:560 length:543 start_codon:yes stop_codon:yes gene_type:complete